VAVRTERREVSTKTTEGQYSPERLELARLVSSLLYGTRAMLVLNLPAFENKKYTAYDRFHGNYPYGEIPTKKEPIKTFRFTSRLPCHMIIHGIQLETVAYKLFHRKYSAQHNQWYIRPAHDGNVQRFSSILIGCIFYGMITNKCTVNC